MALPKLPKLSKLPAAYGGPRVAAATKPPASKIPAAYGGSLVAGSAMSPPSAVPSSQVSVPKSDFNFGGAPQIDPNAYLTQLQGDPMYQGAGEAFNAAIGSGRQSLADQIKQLVIRGGWDLRSKIPSGLSQYASDIDQATLDTATGNPLSARAQLDQQFQQGQNDLAYNLAGRGVERSGGLATGTAQLQQGYDKSTYDAQNQLLDLIGQGSSNFATLSANATAARNAAYEAAANRLAQVQAAASARDTYGPGTIFESAPTAADPYGMGALQTAIQGTTFPTPPTQKQLAAQYIKASKRKT